MQVIETIEDMRRMCKELKRAKTLGFVPTMGALHEGHMSLVRKALGECGEVVASIFVNPLQFGPGEDFSRYPRTLEEDCKLLKEEGVAAVFAPSAEVMYPGGAVTTVTVAGVGDRLDGASRPGHFTGVATVVAKLFHIVSPDRAYFGQKDAAQVAVLRKMVKDLNFGVEVVACPIVRDADGMALSSRNRYLSVQERVQGMVLSATILELRAAIARGERESRVLVDLGMWKLEGEPGVKVDYLAVVDAETLLPAARAEAGTLVAVAAWVGSTRLIDNFLVE